MIKRKHPVTQIASVTPNTCSWGLLTTYRWRICFITLTGTTCLLAMRVNLGFAIVCMIIPENKTELSSEFNSATLNSWFVNAANYTTSNTSFQENPRICGLYESVDSSVVGQGSEFMWDRRLQSKLLASFYYGYIVTQIPGGWLARRYGSRDVIGYSFIVLVLSTLLFPVATRFHVAFSFTLRIVAGLASGVVFPAISALWGRWAPPLERSKLFAVQSTGTPLGTVLGLFISGFLCEYGFDNGWGSVFYMTGLCGLAWVILWFLAVYDTPETHPKIPVTEKEFIVNSIGDKNPKQNSKLKTPWRQILTSSAVWAGVVAHFCTNWGVTTLLTGLPTYMKEVLAFDIKQNGLLSAVPFICSTVFCPVYGYVADSIQAREWLSTQNTRRLFESISGFGTAVFLILTGFVRCDNRLMSVVYLSVASTCVDAVKAGQGPNSLDIAPRFSGEIWGLSNTIATLPGMIAPIVNGILTPNGTQEEWQIVFYVCAAFSAFKAIFFFIFVKGHVLPWATVTVSMETEIDPPTRQEVKDISSYVNSGADISDNAVVKCTHWAKF